MKSSCCHSKLHSLENNRSICLNKNCDNYLGSIPFTYSPQSWNSLFAFFFFVFIFLFTLNDYSYPDHAITDFRNSLLKINQTDPVTPAKLKSELKSQDIACRDEVFAQIQIESGHMTSYLFRKTNNLCGMRYPAKRSTSAIGIFLPESDSIILGSQKELKKYSHQNNYAVYANWQDCLKDYKLWQDQCFRLKEKYLSFLSAYYAEDADYVNKINSIKK